jgi:Protein of unknown function (DUF998)
MGDRQSVAMRPGPEPAGARARAGDLLAGSPSWTRRRLLAWTFTVAGLVAYNWWILVPLKPGLMSSPDELFSNLEVDGRPYASVMQHADLAAGLLLAVALLILGRGLPAMRKDWLAMLAFALAGSAGGIFPEVCEDGINAQCRSQEWHFELPVSQYLHMAAGIVEFAAITVALLLAWRRTRDSRLLTARVYRRLWAGALICYPLLGLAYLVKRMGGVMEAIFFAGFTIMVITQVAERTRLGPGSTR